MRGRITSIYFIDHGIQPIGIPLLGLLAKGVGTADAIIFAGLAALGIAAFMGLRWRDLWGLR